MSKLTAALLVVVLLVLTMGSANAWVRARMFDGSTPMGPQWPLLEKPGWELERSNGFEEFRTSELNGPASDQRISWKVLIPENTSSRGKLKVRIDNIDGTRTTSAVWSGCILTAPKNTLALSAKIPAIYIRIGAGSVKFYYNNDDTAGKTRGWYCNEGTVLDGGTGMAPLWAGGPMGLNVAHGVWHKVRLTAYTDGTWKFWVNDSSTEYMTGTLGGSTGNYVQWGAVDGTNGASLFLTEYFYWGQDAEIDQIPEAMSVPQAVVNGDTATITWTTTKTTNINKVYYGKTFYNPDTPTWQAADAVNVGGVWTATLTDLDMSQTYTFYCESTDETGFEYDTCLETFKTGETPHATVLNPGFESGVDMYPWVDVYPPTVMDDTQQWGRIYKDIDFGTTGIMLPASGHAFSGFKIAGTLFRKNCTARQKLIVEPGKWYKATMKFSGWGNIPYGTNDMIGRIGLDPNGHDTPGQIVGEAFISDPDVWWGQTGASVIGQYATATVYAKSIGNEMSIFLQGDYNAANSGCRLAFDDVTFAESDIQPATSCAAAKTAPALNAPVDLQNVVVTARWTKFDGSVTGYVEDANRTSGLRIECTPESAYTWPANLLVGSEVDVVGMLALNADKELMISPRSVTPAALPQNNVVYPIGVTNKNTGGSALNLQPGVENGYGTNNTGLLVKTWGLVKAVGQYHNQNMDYSIYIDDGSNLTAAGYDGTSTYPGIEVVIPGDLYLDPSQFVPDQTYVKITGISSVRTANTVQKPVIIIRDANDIQ